MTGIGLCYAAMAAVLGFLSAYFFIVARVLSKQVEDLTVRLNTSYELIRLIGNTESKKIDGSVDIED